MAAEPHHSTANKDGYVTHITVAVTDGCGPMNNAQQFSIGDGQITPLRIRKIGQMGHLLLLLAICPTYLLPQTVLGPCRTYIDHGWA
eukprot:8640661-Ditylum_brightwellii.AAC.1